MFNQPIKNNISKKNILSILNNNSNIHGPGKNYLDVQSFLKKEFNFKNTFLTNSCTSALEIAALSLDMKKNDEVILPSFSFITTGSSFVRTGAKLIYCDIEKENLMPSLNQILSKITKKTKAIVILHYQGFSINYLDELVKICKKKKIYLIEDAAQALGSKFKKTNLGKFGDLACFSFHHTKNFHSGIGGCLVVNNNKLHKKIEYIYDKGSNRIDKIKGKIDYFSWVCLGSSFLMSELHAAYLIPQLKKYKYIINKRKKLYEIYLKRLEHLNNKNFFIIKKNNYEYNYHAIVITFRKKINLKKILNYLKKKKINAYICYFPLHASKFGKKFQKGKLPNTNHIFKNSIRLPLNFYLNSKNINYVCDKLINYFIY